MAESSSYDDIISRQRQEKKELLAKTQKMKHAISKGDKKKKKEVTTEIAQMLSNLDLKHNKELKEFELSEQNPESRDNTSGELNPEIVEEENENEIPDICDMDCLRNNSQADEKSPSISRKLSKAQKRRNKKAQDGKEREKAIAEQEIKNLRGTRFLESAEITKKLTERKLVIHEVPSDGNCLYKAIEHQLSTLNLDKYSVEALRELTSKFLLSHTEDYIPFITDPNTGDILTEGLTNLSSICFQRLKNLILEFINGLNYMKIHKSYNCHLYLRERQYIKYCEDIKNTSAWGGHVEIQALAHICGKPIEIIQAEGPSIITGDDSGSPKLIISYHRHAYGLGEHYNSVIPL